MDLRWQTIRNIYGTKTIDISSIRLLQKNDDDDDDDVSSLGVRFNQGAWGQTEFSHHMDLPDMYVHTYIKYIHKVYIYIYMYIKYVCMYVCMYIIYIYYIIYT